MKILLLSLTLTTTAFFIQVLLLFLGATDANAYTVITDETEFFTRYESPTEIITFETLVDGKGYWDAKVNGSPYLTGRSSNCGLEVREDGFTPNWYFRSKDEGWVVAVCWNSANYIQKADSSQKNLVLLKVHPDTSPFVIYTGDNHTGFQGIVPDGPDDNQVYYFSKDTIIYELQSGFSNAKYQLSVTFSGNGHGTVTSDDNNIDCPIDCEYKYTYGTEVILRAVESAGSSFSGWTGGNCSGQGTTCTITIGGDMGVVANFTLDTYPLTVELVGKGQGKVTSDLLGIDCPDDCDELYDFNHLVVLTATPNSGSQFKGWRGNCVGMDLSCTIIMDQAKNVHALFNPFPWPMFLPAIIKDKK